MSELKGDSGLGIPPYDARIVANYILYFHRERSSPITQLRLYKLLYFAHGWNLVERDAPLIWNYFEAWQHGPVVKVVRDNFASFGESEITTFAEMFDLRRGQTIELPHRLSTEDETFVDAVIEAYRNFTAIQLSLLTHTAGSPWEGVWKARKPVGRFGLRIKNDEILADFLNVVDKVESPYKIPPLNG